MEINYPTAMVIATGIVMSFSVVITFMILTFRLIRKGNKKE